MLRDKDLIYAAEARCPCGAGLAYQRRGDADCWDCADILTGRAIPKGQPGSVEHSDRRPFTLWEIKSEQQPSAVGRTTRPLSEEQEAAVLAWRKSAALRGLGYPGVE